MEAICSSLLNFKLPEMETGGTIRASIRVVSKHVLLKPPGTRQEQEGSAGAVRRDSKMGEGWFGGATTHRLVGHCGKSYYYSRWLLRALVHERLEEALARCIQLVLPMVLQAHVAALAILRLPLKLHKISLQEGNLGNTPAVTAPTDSAWRRPRARRAVIVRRVEHGPLVRDPTGCPPAEKA